MTCACCDNESADNQLLQKFMNLEQEMVVVAKSMVKQASDPISAVIRFLQDRPEDQSMPGYLLKRVLLDTFGDSEHVPDLLRIITGHMRELVRHSNVIDIVNEHPNTQKWGNFVVRQADRIKFEVGLDKGKLALQNIKGLFGVEHGVEVPLEKIVVSPPQLIVTVKLGLLHPQRTVNM